PQGRVDLEVAQVDGGKGVEEDRPEDPGEADHVLVFHPVAVREAVDLDGDQVGSGADVVGDVEFGGGEGAFAVADLGAVDPQVEAGLDAFEVEVDAAALPGRGEREGPAVLADRVEPGGRERRLGVLA
ncbi:hypothetical protein ADL26_15355, partial [Thermoactinomyces vulgaris]